MGKLTLRSDLNMEIIGRDKITQSGDKSVVKIDNRQSEKVHHWYQTWWGKTLLALMVAVVAGIILYFFGWN